IACAMLVWLRLKNLAYQTCQTIYRIKHNLLDNYLIQQLKPPDVQMCLPLSTRPRFVPVA
ncbi:MAG: hypothetical protein ACYTXY_31145, partial [Nostoc sp.]